MNIIKEFREKFVGSGKFPKRIADPILVDTIETFILKALSDQDKKHFFELEEVRTKEGGLRISQHKIYDKKLSDQREEIRKEIEKQKWTSIKGKTGMTNIQKKTIINIHNSELETLKDIINKLK